MKHLLATVLVAGVVVVPVVGPVQAALAAPRADVTPAPAATMDPNMPGMDPNMPGMDHGDMATMDPNMPGMDHGSMPPTAPTTGPQVPTMDPDMPGMDHGDHATMDPDMPGMDHGDMPGMDSGAPVEHPRALVLGGFAAVNAAALGGAGVLRRRTRNAPKGRRGQAARRRSSR